MRPYLATLAITVFWTLLAGSSLALGQTLPNAGAPAISNSEVFSSNGKSSAGLVCQGRDPLRGACEWMPAMGNKCIPPNRNWQLMAQKGDQCLYYAPFKKPLDAYIVSIDEVASIEHNGGRCGVNEEDPTHKTAICDRRILIAQNPTHNYYNPATHQFELGTDAAGGNPPYEAPVPVTPIPKSKAIKLMANEHWIDWEPFFQALGQREFTLWKRNHGVAGLSSRDLASFDVMSNQTIIEIKAYGSDQAAVEKMLQQVMPPPFPGRHKDPHLDRN